MTELYTCQKCLPEEEFKSIFKLWKENKMKYFSLFSGNKVINYNEGNIDRYGACISQLIVYDVVDNNIFIRLHIINMIECPYNYLILLSKLVEKEFPDMNFDTNITIYGCELICENTMKVFIDEEVLEDTEIIDNFPWELEKSKYRFYKFNYKYQDMRNTNNKIILENTLLLSNRNNHKFD